MDYGDWARIIITAFKLTGTINGIQYRDDISQELKDLLKKDSKALNEILNKLIDEEK